MKGDKKSIRSSFERYQFYTQIPMGASKVYNVFCLMSNLFAVYIVLTFMQSFCHTRKCYYIKHDENN